MYFHYSLRQVRLVELHVPFAYIIQCVYVACMHNMSMHVTTDLRCAVEFVSIIEALRAVLFIYYVHQG